MGVQPLQGSQGWQAPAGHNSCHSGWEAGLNLQGEIIECVLVHDQGLIQQVLGHLDRERDGRGGIRFTGLMHSVERELTQETYMDQTFDYVYCRYEAVPGHHSDREFSVQGKFALNWAEKLERKDSRDAVSEREVFFFLIEKSTLG